MKKLSVFLCGIVLALTVSGSAYALSFSEDFEVPGPGFREAGLPGWTLTPSVVLAGVEQNRMGTYDPQTTQYTGLDTGETVAWINPRGDGSSSPNQFSRYLGENLVVGTDYSFKVDVGWRNDKATMPLYELVFGAKINNVWTVLKVIDNDDAALTRGQFVDVELKYLATGLDSAVLGEIGIQLRDVFGSEQVNFDNILVTSRSVPDASIMFLLGPGLVGLGLFGRRKFRR